ncbi:hypothetical protein [Chryseobacterium cucumeris]|uniref:hypothetical protein n=1 Tax=Chryseobacterium cucumeris TaxID=1813611 RepID=UPI00192DD77B|nr:hypothetical protein [Chryseobacterium cucumeris]QRA41212.1 hypothetical protein JNG87_11230 [Chryseobacterium cucumeris]
MNTEFPFQRFESATNRWMTVVLNALFFVMFISFVLLFVLGPAYGIYRRGFEAMLYPALISWGLSLLILIPAIRYIIKRKKPAHTIVVDETGLLFYNSRNEIADQILYTDLRPSKQNFDIYTVNPVGSGITPLLEVTVLSDKKEETTRRIDMNLPFKVVKNKSALYAHFLHGIVIFRPDLTIDPFAFRNYSIDTETWKVNSNGISLGGWLLFLAALIITALICGLVFLLTEIKN